MSMNGAGQLRPTPPTPHPFIEKNFHEALDRCEPGSSEYFAVLINWADLINLCPDRLLDGVLYRSPVKPGDFYPPGSRLRFLGRPASRNFELHLD